MRLFGGMGYITQSFTVLDVSHWSFCQSLQKRDVGNKSI